jgi:transposase
MAAAAVVAGLAWMSVVAPAAATSNTPPGQTVHSAAQLPGNAIRREHVLLQRSLDDLMTYLRMSAKTRKDQGAGKADDTGGSLLKRAMSSRGLEWRDSADALPRWRLAYILNPKARDAITSIQTRARLAEHIERIIAEDRAFTDGNRNGQLSARSITRLRTWMKLGREFAGSFERYYPSR